MDNRGVTSGRPLRFKIYGGEGRRGEVAGMKERVIATIHQKQEDGQWRMVGEQDMTEMGMFELWDFYRKQLQKKCVVIPKRREV